MLDPEYAYYRDYVRGMKTGFTTLAGRCFVAFAQKDGHTYGLVVLGCDTLDNIYRECAEIFDWAFELFGPSAGGHPDGADHRPADQVPHGNAVALYAAAPVSGYGHADDEVTYSFDLPESISATVKGAVVGTATVYLDGYEMGTVDLVTHQEYVSDFRTDAKTTLLLWLRSSASSSVLGFLTMVAGGGSLNLRRRSRSRRR